jgi:hypothetical protein
MRWASRIGLTVFRGTPAVHRPPRMGRRRSQLVFRNQTRATRCVRWRWRCAEACLESRDVAQERDRRCRGLSRSERIGGQLERLASRRLQAKRVPNATEGRVTQADRLRHLTRTPVRLAVRRGLQRANDDLLARRRSAAAPGPGSSCNPSSRCRTNRPRHLNTVARVTHSRCAATLLSAPSAQAKMRRASRAKDDADRDRWANDSSCCRWSVVRINASLGRPVRMLAFLSSSTSGPRHVFQFLRLRHTSEKWVTP